MKKKESRKPTNNELKDAINGLIDQYTSLVMYMNRIDGLLGSYIEFNKNGDEFREWISKILKEKENGSNEQNVDESSGGDRKAKVKDIKSGTKKGKSKSKKQLK